MPEVANVSSAGSRMCWTDAFIEAKVACISSVGFEATAALAVGDKIALVAGVGTGGVWFSAGVSAGVSGVAGVTGVVLELED